MPKSTPKSTPKPSPEPLDPLMSLAEARDNIDRAENELHTGNGYFSQECFDGYLLRALRSLIDALEAQYYNSKTPLESNPTSGPGPGSKPGPGPTP